jgi:hypothetical protein
VKLANGKRPLAPGPIVALRAGAELLVPRDAFPPGSRPGKLVLNGADFECGGSVDLFRQQGGARKGALTQDLR